MADYIAGSAASSGGFGSPKSVTVLNLSGETDVVVWATDATDTASPAAPTCDGNAMTQVGSDVTAFFGITLRLFRYIAGNPSGNLVVAADPTDGAVAIAAWATNATDQTTPAGTPVTSTGPASGTDFDLSPSAGGSSDYVMMAAHIASASAPDGSLDGFADDVSVNSGGFLNAIGRAATGAGAQTLGFTTSTDESAGGIAVAVLDSGGAASTAVSGEITFSTFDLAAEISNIGVTVNPEGELVLSTFDLLGDDFTVYISGFSEMILGTEITGSVMGQITAVISGAVEFGTEMTLAAASTLQRIATATLDLGVTLMGAVTGGDPVLTAGIDLVRTGATFVRGVIRDVISSITRRY